MKIQIKQLRPSPFRDLEKNPVPAEKVRMLVKSIKETGFWDNTPCRQHPTEKGAYQLPAGHARLKALWETYGKISTHTVDIPMRQLSDDMMVKMMAYENAGVWGKTTASVLEAVAAAEKQISVRTEIQPTPQAVTKFLGEPYELWEVTEALKNEDSSGARDSHS